MQRDERNDVFEDEGFLDLSEGFDADDGGEVSEKPDDLDLCPDAWHARTP